MDAALDPRVGLPRAVAPYQFDLQVMQRIDVGKAVANGSLKRGVVGQALPVAGDAGKRAGRTVPFKFNKLENTLAQPRVGHQLRVAARQCQIAFCHHHINVR